MKRHFFMLSRALNARKRKIFALFFALVASIGLSWASELTVADGTKSNNCVPYDGYSGDCFQRVQIIYPQSELAAMAGKDITSLTFYVNSQASSALGVKVQIGLAEISDSDFSAGRDYKSATLTIVKAEDVWDLNAATVVVEFSEPFSYSGEGNILFDLQTVAIGEYGNTSFYGVGSLANYQSAYSYAESSIPATSSNRYKFIPKTTFTYEEPAPVVLADCGLGWLNVPEGGVVGTIGHEDEIVLPQVNASLDFILAFQAHTATLRLGSTDESVLAVYGFNNFAVNGVGECDVYVVHDEDAVFAYDSAAFHVTVNPEPTPQPAEDVDITPNVDPENPTFYYSTFFDSSVKYELPENVEAYIVTTVSGDAMQLQKVAEAGQTIPAGAGVILKSRVNGFTLEVSDADAVSVEGNRLEGSDVSIATPANCYVLSCENGLVGFYHYNAAMLNPHKAYIIYDTPNSGNQAPRRLRFAFEQATGVENVQNSDIRSQKVVENGQLIIIRNGVRYNAAGQNVK